MADQNRVALKKLLNDLRNSKKKRRRQTVFKEIAAKTDLGEGSEIKIMRREGTKAKTQKKSI